MDGMHVRQSQGGGRMSGDAGAYTDDTRSHRRPVAQLWFELSRNWSVFLGRPYHGRPRESSGSLSTLHGAPRTHCCSNRYDDGC